MTLSSIYPSAGVTKLIFNECVDKRIVKMTSKKIFIQRDYSFGTAVRFSTDFPRELSGKVTSNKVLTVWKKLLKFGFSTSTPTQVDEATFRQTMEEINAIFEEAEDLSCMTFTEGCLGCLTGYTIHYCFKTHYERVCMLYNMSCWTCLLMPPVYILVIAPHWAVLMYVLFLQSVERVVRYIQQQNHDVYEQRGVVFGDPMDRGLRCVSLTNASLTNHGDPAFVTLSLSLSSPPPPFLPYICTIDTWSA